jgi:hypothetical protein
MILLTVKIEDCQVISNFRPETLILSILIAGTSLLLDAAHYRKQDRVILLVPDEELLSSEEERNHRFPLLFPDNRDEHFPEDPGKILYKYFTVSTFKVKQHKWDSHWTRP